MAKRVCGCQLTLTAGQRFRQLSSRAFCHGALEVRQPTNPPSPFRFFFHLLFLFRSTASLSSFLLSFSHCFFFTLASIICPLLLRVLFLPLFLPFSASLCSVPALPISLYSLSLSISVYLFPLSYPFLTHSLPCCPSLSLPLSFCLPLPPSLSPPPLSLPPYAISLPYQTTPHHKLLNQCKSASPQFFVQAKQHALWWLCRHYPRIAEADLAEVSSAGTEDVAGYTCKHRFTSIYQ